MRYDINEMVAQFQKASQGATAEVAEVLQKLIAALINLARQEYGRNREQWLAHLRQAMTGGGTDTEAGLKPGLEAAAKGLDRKIYEANTSNSKLSSLKVEDSGPDYNSGMPNKHKGNR
jgi:hypothetical protein